MSVVFRVACLVIASASLSIRVAVAQPGGGPPPDQERGLIKNAEGAYQGYTLFSPLRAPTTYLIDMQGRVVHQWECELSLSATYLLPNGHLIGCAVEPDVPRFSGGGQGGRILEYDWDGNLVWSYKYATDEHLQHHDIEPMPNGNVLMIAWEHKTAKEALDAGRHPTRVPEDGLWPDFVIEVKPLPPDGGEIVWEWHVWDHILQETDEALPNYGSALDHPERVDINGDQRLMELSDEELDRLVALGYMQARGANRNRNRGGSDWLHTNGIDYSPELDQIALSVPHMNEIWIIDHSTTTEEARGSTGGRCGKGGDLLYRWGNPQTYRRGTLEEQQLFYQHDAQFVPQGYPGEGSLTIFNNGRGRPDGEYSTMIEIALPMESDTEYFMEELMPFEPFEPEWEYQDRDHFNSNFISGGHRLPNGNTFICSGAQGRLFEVTPDGDVVWDFVNPFLSSNDEGPGGPPGRGGDRGGPDGRRGPPGADRDGRGGDDDRGGPPGDRRGPPDGDDRAGGDRGDRDDGGRGRGGRRGGRGGRDEGAIFRATRIGPDHPGLAGRDLKVKSEAIPPE